MKETMAKAGYTAENERRKQLQSQHFHVVRVSGSIGAMDIIAVSPLDVDCHHIRYEQIKSTRKTTFYFDKMSRSELTRLQDIENEFGIPCFWVIKFKGRGWGVANVKFIDFSPIPWKTAREFIFMEMR